MMCSLLVSVLTSVLSETLLLVADDSLESCSLCRSLSYICWWNNSHG